MSGFGSWGKGGVEKRLPPAFGAPAVALGDLGPVKTHLDL